MSRQKNLKRNLLICLLAGSAVMYTLPLHAATSVVANNALPTLPMVNGQIKDGYGFVTGGNNTNIVTDGLQMNITQNDLNAVIKWGSFDVGGSATVNFKGPESGYNTLNYVNAGGSMSQIYGTINANNNGNIFIVNPAGVQIGNSAQINVGSLYVSNKTFSDDLLKTVNDDTVMNDFMKQGTANADATLMSLGNINATNVTFEGDGRIVIDSERLINGNNSMGAANINIKTAENNIGNIVIGYDGYDETTNSYNTAGTTAIAKVNGQDFAQNKGYMWVEDVEQLQAIGKNEASLTGNYALRNSIDATGTEQNGFNPIGLSATGQLINNGFSGKFDGIDYNIFGLTINDSQLTHVGLFAGANHAVINNVTLVGGSITGGTEVGAIVGAAINGTVINNVINSAAVNGNGEVGGIVGVADDTTITNAINTGAVDGKNNNVGGLVGLLENGSTLNGNSYNLGDVSSEGHNVGGLVGHAVNSTIGDGTNLVYNRLDVTGKYNVGGIVGNMDGTTVQNAENSGNVTATSFDVDGSYTYHSAQYHGEKTEKVNVANVGGIAGKADDTVKTDDKKSVIKNVTNSGNVSSSSDKESQKFTNANTYEYEYYTAGNVGGIVGSAVDTNISNATNRENEVRGAHNVGGVAGYFGGSGKITTGINDGGDIMATGARNASGFVKETVRPVEGGADESFIIGNIGGIVGCLDGDDVFVTASGNRGTVHTQDIAEVNKDEVLNISKAANVGGVVGKIDRDNTDTITKNTIENAAVSNSYNTGDVRGYTGVGGVVGMMYNGEVAGSYNLGYISTTRQSTIGDSIDALNMGGVVGDTTELSGAEVYLYDVYNKGQIGDKEYNYFGRHVGGVVGRLSGTVEKAYNNGAIYNGYNVVGGIAGWMAQGKIENAFNTGNITVLNRNNATSQVGGIVGAANVATESITINNVYNLGTLRSFKADNNSGGNTLGGIIGEINEFKGNKSNELTISNAYTTGNLYVSNGTIGSIYGNNTIGGRLNVENTYYIRPDENLVEKRYFTDLYDQNNTNADKDNSNKAIAFGDKDKGSSYSYYDNSGNYHSLTFTQQSGGNVDGGKYQNGQDSVQVSDDNWRIYDGNTPILNAFLPDSEKYFAQNGLKDHSNNPDKSFTGTIQYGTAYDPLLTIINTNRDLTFNFGSGADELSISNAAGIAVYGGGLTFNNFATSSGTGYFGGTIYADGALNLNSNSNIGLGSAAQIYGSVVNIATDGKVTIYGDVTATGNTADVNIDAEDAGNITITGSDVDVYGTLTTGKNVSVPGIEDKAVNTWTPGAVSNPNAEMVDIADRFAHKTTNSNDDGNIKITAKGTADGSGNVNLYYGNKQEGLITSGGDLNVTSTGNVYVDSDLDIGGNLTLEAGAGNEALLDITNIGQVQAKNGTVAGTITGLNNFLNHFVNTGNNKISFGNTTDAKITVDMWNGNELKLDKFGNDFTNKLDKLNLNGKYANEITHIWVNNGEQLKNIQTADDKALGYNYALKGDINASDVTDYEAIGGTTGFTGTFDGRGNRIIGLDTTKGENGGNTNSMTNAGIFSTIGEGGTVKNVNIYSGNFEGTNTAGAVAGMNSGRIENVTGFGNTVTVTGDTNNAGNAGGIVGVNNGTGTFNDNNDSASTLIGYGIYDVQSIGSVIAGNNKVVAGGLVGTNNGSLGNSYSDSAVTSTAGTTEGLGGVVGVNTVVGNVQYVDSLGVTNGGTNSNKVGGIIGVNNGNMYSGYNESIVTGNNNVGGIIGVNSEDVTNIVNATGVEGHDYVGGLIGDNAGNVTDGRNNGTITGNEYVGGMVGSNADGSQLKNLTNGESADITGENYVGGIAGTNAGTITAQNQANLINRGSITGQNYVGGVAGENIGTIEYVKNDVSLNVKDSTKDAAYFGGVAGINGRVDDKNTTDDESATGTITSATNEGNVIAVNADYVGGIVGHNTVNGVLDGMGNSNDGRVEGATYVGGVAGKNDAAITGAVDDMVGIANNGVVIAHKGGAGGIFGENTGNIEYAELTNNGIVSGTYNADKVAGTGGLIGVNSGEIKHSSLKNNIGGQVIGTQNVGGLIGVNTGTITGGRIEADGKTDAGYYKYQIYNNGVINVGTWTDNNGNGVVDAGEIKGLAEGVTSTNIGGLIGYNADETDNGGTKGSLTAGYNTGAINAGQSTNVGGIVGNNAGTVDQVFNTVMTPNGEGTITGGTNVGGLVGTNSGTLNNAYNTTGVEGNLENAVVGNAVGENSGTITNIYAANTTGHLIGSGYDKSKVTNAYSFVSNDASATEVISETADTDNDGITDRIDSDSYDGFDFTNGTWKNYDGSGNPLLKVFLTTVKVDTDDLPNLVYNTKDQDLNIDGLTGVNGAFSAVDDFTAYENNNSLIQNTGFEHKNAGTYDNWLYSQQIASGSQDGTFNPNNLGYDIELTHDIDKAQITVDLNEVERTYGDTTILNNGNYNYSYDFANVTDETDLANLRNELNNNDVLSLGNVDKTKDDGGLVGDGTKTNNAGDYNWTGTVNIVDGYQGNYEFVLTTEQSNDNQSSLGTNGTSITTIGDSIVDKRQLSISDIIANIMYGNQNGSGFIITSGGTLVGVNSEEGIVYDDDVTLDTILSVTDANIVAGSSYADNKGNRVTADVGTYKDSLNLSGLQLTGDDAKNYELADTSVGGTIVVNKATITLDLSDVNRTYGNANITSGGYDVVNVNNNDVNGNNTNGDSYDANDFIVIVNNGDDGALTGNTEDRVTNDVGSYTYTGTVTSDNEKLNQNYDIVVNNSANDNNVGTGNSYVNKADLIININDVETTYGTAFDESKYGYGFGDNGANGLVNGDVLEDVKDAIDSAAGGYENTGAADSTNGKVTQDAKDGYSLSFNNELSNTNTLKNYNIITVNNGDSTVNKKQITIGANDEQILVGETPNYSGTDIDSVLVNGDSLNGNYHYGVEDSSIESVVGTYNDAIGVWIGGSFYDISNPDWSNLPGMSFFANYNVTFEPGTLTVSAYDIPEDWPHNRWDYLFNDAPFDRNKDFRERKAEVNFVDGAMEI